jgi:hypothetical protein
VDGNDVGVNGVGVDGVGVDGTGVDGTGVDGTGVDGAVVGGWFRPQALNAARAQIVTDRNSRVSFFIAKLLIRWANVLFTSPAFLGLTTAEHHFDVGFCSAYHQGVTGPRAIRFGLLPGNSKAYRELFRNRLSASRTFI